MAGSLSYRVTIGTARAAATLPHRPARREVCARACSSSISSSDAATPSSSGDSSRTVQCHAAGRRALLISGAVALAGSFLGPRSAAAEQVQLLDESLASQLPGEAPAAPELPRGESSDDLGFSL